MAPERTRAPAVTLSPLYTASSRLAPAEPVSSHARGTRRPRDVPARARAGRQPPSDEDQCWTLARIAEVIRSRFKVDYTLAGVGLLLHREACKNSDADHDVIYSSRCKHNAAIRCGSAPRRGLPDERSLPCHDASRLDDEVTDRVGHDRLRRGARVDDDDVGPRAGLEAIGLQAECPCSAVGGRFQRHLDLLVAPEGTA